MAIDAGSVGTSVGEAREVAAAAQESWRVAGEEASVVEWDAFVHALGLEADNAIAAAVVVPKEQLVECVVDATASLRDAMTNFSALVSEGWSVNALLPVASMGQAHQAWRGLNIHLQGFWSAEGRGLRFTSPELP